MAIFTATESIGRQLLEARVRKGLVVEDVEFKTHIPAARVRELENDDFSNFANLTYARSFLKLYANFLGLDISDYLSEFNTRELADVSGHEFIQSANSGISALGYAAAPNPNRGRWKGVALLLVLVGGICGTIYASKYWKSGEAAPETAAAPAAPAVKSTGTFQPGPSVADAGRINPTVPPAIPAPASPALPDAPQKPPKARPILPALPTGGASPADNDGKANPAPEPGAIEIKPALTPDENA
ncbi:MAG: helix-turn-helix domain-containing protein [Verrucomicrobiales bacterium]|nr:helix-turn-helix domain-containing protein [Verrucomicrobiales bacterium]